MSRIEFQRLPVTINHPFGSIAVFEDNNQVEELPITELGLNGHASRQILQDAGFSQVQARSIVLAAQDYLDGRLAGGFDLV
ncbi:MAG TPA: hypothetical protein PLN27_15605 [Acidobacteriota bacterium]|jgi:hypothetical protein|nr:hypothetical protein [Acidobacteriota bacterium]